MMNIFVTIVFLESVVNALISPNIEHHAFTSSSSCRSSLSHTSRFRPQRRQYVHSEVVSPFATQLPSHVDFIHDLNRQAKSNGQPGDSVFSKLCSSFGANPRNLLRFESTPDSVRGVYLNDAVNEGGIILSIPLQSCLVDNKPPSWFKPSEASEGSSFYNPSSWATSLAASLIDMQLKSKHGSLNEGQSLWLSLLPDPEFLRASLPVHWPEETLQNARSTALELAVDSAFFARAQAEDDLISALKQCSQAENMSDEELKMLCSNALDVVQTRSCRLQHETFAASLLAPRRVLAPIFDFINHGSIVSRGDHGANAEFQLEGFDEQDYRLVVRATKFIKADEEVLIDYGESARPAWKCLLSYGFVPQYNRIPGPGESTTDDDYDENVAEVYMNGVRYDVGPSSIPAEMVLSATASMYSISNLDTTTELADEAELVLTPEIALRIARRISDVAYQLLLVPERDLYDDHPAATPTPFQVISSRQAASLRWSQHRVLLACAMGLHQFAADETSYL